jgi:Phosphodiester glycosidase
MRFGGLCTSPSGLVRILLANPCRRLRHALVAPLQCVPMESGVATGQRPLARVPAGHLSEGGSGFTSVQRLRRIVLVAALVALIPAAVSYLSTISGPSNSSLGIRTVEWLRGHGAAGLVSKVESIYYSLTAPAKGGPALRALPSVGYAGASGHRLAGRVAGTPIALPSYRPPRVGPLLQPPLPGEGVWRAARPVHEAASPLLVTTLRNQPEYPRVAAGLAWIDTQRTSVTFNPGREEPSGEIPRGSMAVPQWRRGKLLATFNSGFKLSDSGGGVVLGGHTYAPLRDGMATFLGYSDGRVDVRAWHGEATAPHWITFARQNLPLIVSEGHINPNLNDSAEWGATLGNAVLVWRSAVGVDRRGNLIYAAANDQTVRSLAATLLHAGAVRAMELDINSYWVSFITYGRAGGHDPVNLLPDMNRSPFRYLEPDDRDFFAVYER